MRICETVSVCMCLCVQRKEEIESERGCKRIKAREQKGNLEKNRPVLKIEINFSLQSKASYEEFKYISSPFFPALILGVKVKIASFLGELWIV